ncbi:P-loop NTPase fold protein [Aliarcobacter cryaerophilus]|uniref:P-loop NTPase fold protein n=1 Tax=Aliarcobacter cryaerophilus TaxID=28198 RepID=UPI001653EFE4|nr:P-loop NTPase fold protein [Aliarcobacter cryaerophilus]QNM87387.1 AAA family ATPase [Aliarcobacter cryaerophilus]
MLLDDDVYKNLNTNQTDGVKNIIENYKSDNFFSLALIGAWGSGKSSFLWNLQQQITKDKVIYLNVWKLENIQNILQEIEKEFDNIIFECNKTGWAIHHLKSIFIRDYFSTLSKYFLENKININLSFSQTIQESKNEYNMLLKESLQDKKIVLMLDEIDRLDSKDDILNIFKVIRYLASFDKVFTITAIDIEKVGEKVGLDYTHKIFNSKYTIPITTKSEIHDFLKVEISKKLSSFIEEDFEKLLKIKVKEKILIDYINTYREIKNCYNDTYILCQSLENGNKNWNKYIDFEFIFILNLIKSLNFDFYIKIMKDKTLTNLVLGELFYKKITSSSNYSDTKEKDEKVYIENIKDYEKFGEIIELYTILLRNRNLEQSFYVYEHYRIYDYMFTELEYKEFLEDTNKAKEKFNSLSYDLEEQKSFIIFLISHIYGDEKIKNVQSILKTIKELIASDDEFLKLIYRLLENFDDRGISRQVIEYMFKIYFESLELDTKEDSRILIENINENISKITNTKLKFDLYKIAYNYFKTKDLQSDFKVSLCNSQNLIELNSSDFSQFIKLIEYLKETPNGFFEDNQQYMLWTQNSDNSNMMTHYEYSGKEIKDIINKGNSN